ncbi:MAG: SRPBCC family protein [Chloracidobacterium sp.]|nr:SRPBCC family protein [Chloracidobacterium sp.]
MIKKLILGLLALIFIGVVVLCVVVAMQPADFKITRSATFNAPPEKVFEQINDFHKWEAWSPWAKIDPNMKTTYSGPATGTGAGYAWAGNDEVGEGKMTITESRPSDTVKIDLEFIRPFAAKNVTDFSIKANGEKSDVTWTMTGTNNFMMKAFGLVMNMDKLVGGDFEKGLAQMKPIVEASAATK